MSFDQLPREGAIGRWYLEQRRRRQRLRGLAATADAAS